MLYGTILNRTPRKAFKGLPMESCLLDRMGGGNFSYFSLVWIMTIVSSGEVTVLFLLVNDSNVYNSL